MKTRTNRYLFILLLSIVFIFLVDLKLYASDNNYKKTLTLSKNEKIEKIIQFYKERLKDIPNLEIKFVEEKNNFPFEAYVFEFKTNTEQTKEVIFIKDNFFFNEYVDFNTLEFSKDKVQEELSKDKYSNIIKELMNDKKYIITLGNGNKEVYVFSDPECPFCQKHLKNIDEKYLKEHTIHFIFISVHDNFKILTALYNDLDKAKTKQEKLAIIKKFYFGDNDYKDFNFKNNEKYKEEEIKKIFDKYLKLGVNYTPFIINWKL